MTQWYRPSTDLDFAVRERPTAAKLDKIGEDFKVLAACADLYLPFDQGITANGFVTVTDWWVGVDTNSFHATPNRITIPWTGYYTLMVTTTWADVSGAVHMRLRGDGSTDYGTTTGTGGGGGDVCLSFTRTLSFTAGQYLELLVRSQSGSSANLVGNGCFFNIAGKGGPA